MQRVSDKMGIDRVSLIKMIDFLPYPFLVSEFRDGAQHNIFVNKKFIEEIGYTCQDIPTIADWFISAYPDPAYRNEIMQDWAERIKAAKEAGEDSVIKKARIHTKSHGLKWYQVKASLYDQLNFVAFINIDEEIIREETLERLNENKDRTLSILSHDLRTPLSNLYSILFLLTNGDLSAEETRSSFQKISSQVFKMLEFLDTTLQWSKVNFNELHPSSVPVDGRKVIETILGLYENAVNEKEITLVLDLSDDSPFHTDPEILSILFRNIFSNAIKYTPPGGKISVTCGFLDGRPMFAVSNSGVPISQEKISSIYANSYKSDRGTKGEKGLGLGLRLCLQLLENINGKLKITTRENNTTFSVTM